MALITPLSALPASGSTPAGTLTLSNLQGRLTVVLTSGGAAQLDLIMQTEGGAWAYVPGARLTINSQAILATASVGWTSTTPRPRPSIIVCLSAAVRRVRSTCRR